MQNGTNRNGNGVHADAAVIDGHDLLWDGLPPAVTKALAQPLDPALVSQRRGRGNRTFAYLEGHVAIDQANRIFGYGGWGHELVGDVALREVESLDPKTGEVTRAYAYSAVVRVTVPGAPPRTDVGFHPVTEETAEGHDTAIKGAVTDGMKRGLRTYGQQFGNGLYGDQASAGNLSQPERVPVKADGRPGHARANGGKQPGQADRIEESRVRAMRAELIELGARQGFDEAAVRVAVKRQTGVDLDDLPASKLTTLVERAARKAHEAQAA